MTPNPKPRSRPKPPRGKTLHGHPLGYKPSCPKCLKRRAHNREVAKRALLKQRRAIRTKIQAKGKPRFKQGRDPAKLAWIRQWRCDLSVQAPLECAGLTQPAHIRSRGASGKEAGPQVLPLCTYHHAFQHYTGIRTFATTFYGGMDAMLMRAGMYDRQYRRAVELGWTPGDV